MPRCPKSPFFGAKFEFRIWQGHEISTIWGPEPIFLDWGCLDDGATTKNPKKLALVPKLWIFHAPAKFEIQIWRQKMGIWDFGASAP